jgi:hypothetical protein
MEDSKLPLRYISSGRLGDFILQLSIIYEYYLNTGRKGLLYISEKDSEFTNGLQETYEDTYEIIISQPYIEDYKIYCGEVIDIDLSTWRYNDLWYSGTLRDIFIKEYNIDWGKKKWLYLDETKYDEKWKNTVLINIKDDKFKYLDYQSLYDKYGKKLVFISFTKKNYDNFIEKTNINIPFYLSPSFTDLCIAINSCEIFVGNLSMPLAIAYSLHRKSIIACNFPPHNVEEIHNANYDSIWKHVSYLKPLSQMKLFFNNNNEI